MLVQVILLAIALDCDPDPIQVTDQVDTETASWILVEYLNSL